MSAETDTQAEETQASTGITPDTLKATLEQELQASYVNIVDQSGTY